MSAITKAGRLFNARSFILTRNISRSSVNDNDDLNIVHPEAREPHIPPYVERQGEDITLKRARLIYQSRKRGMLENGLLLSTFAKKYLDNFNESQMVLYDRLINLPSNDWDIFHWAAEVKPTPSEFDNEVMDLLKEHVKNKDRVSRLMQPELIKSEKQL
ncbi:succinate dehydrogenase assembly factor 2, mitochondrial [Neodiprion pinetum]|uniref:Succinate dehydrogenase assembly factor 2, mitochondrial n=2 Tax=Neodiprion lecontei TaxID=441921 RepID=A0A6J0BLL6_NEOLC|nr:succinate dehydrogenase assembly factor 2, mitochondrial isoform X1 [Neodiprion lecontei]XP_046431625.1 succinate dehydrogenase assembly factor 2, mitochondrial-like isoform X1 [Neodiprion fabricii]XP_046488168.1 succinate dehydrogenase assembly factor 2, mitochondrial-like isoform X1 [Neodiprion pinetum]XP_046625314.1 succinate dehydrogenase assembly factor 2, mitochondrial-like isoform X1 [Neodiprion virginianus]